MLYFLILTDIDSSYEGYSCDFEIGAFASKADAEDVAAHYLKHVSGFCEFPCIYRIEPVEVFGEIKNGQVWRIAGWNRNEKLDEVDIIESPCFAAREQAESELGLMMRKYTREEWTVSRWIIGERDWKEGFSRG